MAPIRTCIKSDNQQNDYRDHIRQPIGMCKYKLGNVQCQKRHGNHTTDPQIVHVQRSTDSAHSKIKRQIESMMFHSRPKTQQNGCRDLLQPLKIRTCDHT
ncbi:Hypothetical predicted protein [Pelobates cultripes]|uniref:Uncharacterized protein n=1 Tax=Pelobates cultripes TaxID=61616 RepID=A0AAD1W9Y7_PELCU|nr:Hypothetical predicted protein [Pelobates cultripes]